jgi:hypothetical protein
VVVVANEPSNRPDALFMRHLINMVLSNILFCQLMSILFCMVPVSMPLALVNVWAEEEYYILNLAF